jgi:uroporphyrinogen-III decarboxylase
VYGFIGGTRSGSTFISPQVFERFYFPYFQKVVAAMQAINVKTWLHMDNDWSGFLHYFKDLPKGQVIWDPDQMTGILKIKEALGDRMCITGDISPALLSVGTPDQCYEYTKKLCADMGKTGFIMSPGCSVPVDAKRENVAAVIAATLDS